jgi:hypothetical protein
MATLKTILLHSSLILCVTTRALADDSGMTGYDPPRAATPNPEPPPPDESPRASRIAIEALAGVGGEVLLGYTGFQAGRALCSNHHGMFACLGEEVTGVLVGGTIGAIGGVYAGGAAMDGTGRIGYTLVGGLAGTGTALLTTAAFAGASEDSGASIVLAWIALVGMPVAGSILGYELSSDPPPKPPPQEVHVSFVPALGASGGTLRVWGRF